MDGRTVMAGGVGVGDQIQFDRPDDEVRNPPVGKQRGGAMRVIEPMWAMEGIDQVQVITWRLEPYEVNAWELTHGRLAAR